MMRAAYETLQQKKEHLQTELISSQKRCADFQNVNDRLTADRCDLLSELQICKRKAVQCDVDLDEAAKQYNVLKAKLDEANRRLKTSRDEILIKQRQLEEIQHKHETLTRESIQRDSFHEKFKQERRTIEDELKGCLADLEKVQNDLRICQRDNEKVRQDYGGCQQRLHETEAYMQKKQNGERPSAERSGKHGTFCWRIKRPES